LTRTNNSGQKVAVQLKTNVVSLKPALAGVASFALLGGTPVIPADLHPIIDIETGYFFGASENEKWVKPDQAAKAVANETTYQVYGLTEQFGRITATKPVSAEEPCPDTLMVSLSSKPRDGLIGLDAPWNALPRKPKIADTTQTLYVEAVRDFLKARGIADPKVRITRILRVDLEGDGEDEVLINATNYFNQHDEAPTQAPKRGSYSIVMLRRVATGKVQTQLVAGELYSKADASNAPNIYKIAAVLDLNGDGKLEVIVHSFYYEGGETTIYRCEPDKIEPVLSVECGA
jgi:hypothetical protein